MLIALVQEELVINPKANYYLSFSLIENAIALDHIVIKNSFKHFPIGELDITLPMLGVIFELSLIICPSVAQFREVLIVELFIESNWL